MSEHAGKVVRRRSFGPIDVTEIQHPAAARLQTHHHARSCFTFVLAGAFEERFGRAAFRCDQTAFLYRPAGASHSDEFSQAGAAALLIEPDESWFAKATAQARLLSYPRSVQRATAAVPAAKIACELNHADEVSELVVVGLVLQMTGQLQRSYKEERGHAIPSWLMRTRGLLDDSFREPP